MAAISGRDVRLLRFHRHQLHRESDAVTSVTDVDLLDDGVQDTGRDGSRWALVIRGAPAEQLQVDAEPSPRLAIAWTWRGAPHAHRSADLAKVATATAPFSERDAAKRIFDAAAAMRRGHVEVLDGLATVAKAMRAIVRRPMIKGELSARLSAQLGEPYVRFCRPCNATHLYEQPFRLAALQAGLVLQFGTSPPVLERVTGWRPPLYRHLAGDAEPRFDPIRNHLRFFGPTTPADVAGYLDTTRRDVQEHWPADVEPVTVDGAERFVLAGDELDLPDRGGVLRLLGSHDPYLQLRDRGLLVEHAAQRKELWPVIGRPGAIVVDGDVLGTWRPTTKGERLVLTLQPWRKLSAGERTAIDEQAQRLATFRGVSLDAVRTA
jgi:hypothetical protein